MKKRNYETLQLLLFLFDEMDVVRTSDVTFEEEWQDGNADENGWT